MFTFVETPLFIRLITEYLSDEEYLKLQLASGKNPDTGTVIPGTGGVRKIRWAMPGRGKRGGLRVIYYVRSRKGVIWMLTTYPKDVAENIPTPMLRAIREEIKDE